MKYSNTALTQLKRWYKQILIKCAIFNAAIFMVGAAIAPAAHAEPLLNVVSTVASGGSWGVDDNIGTVDMSAYSTTEQINTLLNGYATTTTTNGLQTSINSINTALGSASYTGASITAALGTAQTNISDLQTSVASKAAASDVESLTTRVGTAESNITSLQTTVGDASSGLVKDVNDLQTTVGNATSGLVQAVNTLTGDSTVAGSVDFKIAAAKANTALTGTTTAEALTVGGSAVLTANSELAGAKIAAGTVGTTQLSEDVNASLTLANLALQSTSALNGANLTDASVALSALATGVQTSLGKADTALQPSALNNTALTGNTTAENLTVGGSPVLTTASSINGSQLTAGTVGLAKLSSAVQTSLGRADSALQSGANVSVLTNDLGFQTAENVTASIAAANIAANKITTETYAGSNLQTAVVGSVTSNAASATYNASGDYNNDTIGKAIQTNAGAISANAGAISDINTLLGTTSLTGIVASGKVTDAIAANAANISTNTTNIATNTANIAKVLSGNALSNTLTDASGNKAIIWNEADGGGIRYEQKVGDNVNTVYSGVHGDSTNGVFANMYAKTTGGSSRLMVKGDGVYYLKAEGNNVGITT
ncbi:MAG: hypothetical protein IJS26_00425, partial [Alphaproteobacteria bacterium]|nr:hypothetical protein [Alphaproteobacteria bacterium]